MAPIPTIKTSIDVIQPSATGVGFLLGSSSTPNHSLLGLLSSLIQPETSGLPTNPVQPLAVSGVEVVAPHSSYGAGISGWGGSRPDYFIDDQSRMGAPVQVPPPAHYLVPTEFTHTKPDMDKPAVLLKSDRDMHGWDGHRAPSFFQSGPGGLQGENDQASWIQQHQQQQQQYSEYPVQPNYQFQQHQQHQQHQQLKTSFPFSSGSFNKQELAFPPAAPKSDSNSNGPRMDPGRALGLGSVFPGFGSFVGVPVSNLVLPAVPPGFVRGMYFLFLFYYIVGCGCEWKLKYMYVGTDLHCRSPS